MGQGLQVLQGVPKVKVKDKVVVNLDEQTVKRMQFQHGGWANGMENYLGEKGKVKKIDSDGDVTVRYNDGQVILYNPNIVAKILSKGNIVKITDNEEMAEFLQERKGNWNSKMKKILGKEAKVEAIRPNYDVNVEVDGETWCLNPLLCTVIKNISEDSSSDEDSDEDMSSKMFSEAAKHVMEQLRCMDISDMREMMTTSGLLDGLHLHASVCHGNEEITKHLLEAGVDINKRDDDGDTALHIAIMKMNPKITRLLVSKGANLNILNKKKHAPIHIAVRNGSIECIKELRDSNINIKDKDGDTPLIWAIMREEYDIIDHILSYEEIDLTKKNKKGFAAIHMAAGKGDVKALKKLLKTKSDIVDMQKVDGYSSLHLAAINDNLEASKFLIQKGKATLDIRTNDQETPLMLAAHHKYLNIVKLLVSEGADINAKDKDGNTSLHLAIKSKIGVGSLFEMFMMTPLTKTSSTTGPDIENVIIHLVENGASLSIKNKERKTPLDLITDDKFKADIQKRAESSHCVQEEMPCLLCSETKKLVKFQPCGHMKLCVECNNMSIAIKKCMQCHVVITGRIKPEMEEKMIESDLKRLFKLGDRVCIIKEEAKEHMKKLLKKSGTVTNIGEGAEIHVMFENQEYEFRPQMLTKVFSFKDEVEVFKDVQLVKTLQKGHGEWNEEMNEIIGKTVIVVNVEGTTVIVKSGTKLYSLNPLVCVWINKPKQETANENCCVHCKQKTDEMVQLQCGHKHCSNCKHFGKCKFC